MDRVSSVGALRKTCVSTHRGSSGSSYQRTNEEMPRWATRPSSERSSARSSSNQPRSVSRRRVATVEIAPRFALRFSRVLGCGGVTGRDLSVGRLREGRSQRVVVFPSCPAMPPSLEHASARPRP